MDGKKILLLEDDRLFSETLQDFLEEEGYIVETAYDPLSAFEMSYNKRFDLYLFDINLPFQDGLSAFRELRESNDETPVIFITSRDDKESLLDGFKAGADDYMKKPFDLDELALRIDAVLKRYVRSEPVKIGDYLLDPSSRDIIFDGSPVHLGRKIYDLLELLTSRMNRTVTVEEIREYLWRGGKDASDGAIRVYITRLKKYFPNHIENIRGVGYKFLSDGTKN